MKKEYLEIIFKAVELKDIELLVFILSKDISKNTLKNLCNTNYKDNKNVYEYLLLKNENEMLDVFIKFGYWAHINTPIKNNESLIELAYKNKNLPIIISILSNDNIKYNSSDPIFKKLLDLIKIDYQVSSFLLSYIGENIESITYPNKLAEKNIKLNDVIIQDENNQFYNENFGNKIDDVTNKNFFRLKKIFFDLFIIKKYSSSYKENNKMESSTETEILDIKQDTKKEGYKYPTPEEIRAKIKFKNENIKNLLDEIENTVKFKNIITQNFEIEHDLDFKLNEGLLKNFKDEHNNLNNKQKICAIIQYTLNILSEKDFKKYATIKNFIDLLNYYEIKVLPKIENEQVSSLDFIFNKEKYELFSINGLTMKEIKAIIEINNEDCLFLINEKIKFLKLTEIINEEYIRLFITKSLLESVSLFDFINKIKNEKINIKTNINDFNFENMNKDLFEEIKESIIIYCYEKNDVEVLNEELPEILKFYQIKNRLF